MSEEPLFRASYMEVFHKYEALSADQRLAYRSLYGWKGVNEFQVLAIFKTNRYVDSKLKRLRNLFSNEQLADCFDC
jgi:hypothetical protein